MKLNKYFTLCYSLYFKILHYPRVFTHLAPHLYFPFPTESLETASYISALASLLIFFGIG